MVAAALLQPLRETHIIYYNYVLSPVVVSMRNNKIRDKNEIRNTWFSDVGIDSIHFSNIFVSSAYLVGHQM